MPRLGKKKKQEWSFFIDESGRRRYNPLCRRCKRLCKQSFRASIVQCPSYRSKRNKA
jgi:hypothetical protein